MTNAISTASLAALRALANGREAERTAPHFALIASGLAVITDRYSVNHARVRITTKGRAFLAA